MTEAVHTQAVVDRTEDFALRAGDDTEVGVMARLEEFLQDPIGYGDFDFGDSISLDEFATTRHMHGTYAAVIV